MFQKVIFESQNAVITNSLSFIFKILLDELLVRNVKLLIKWNKPLLFNSHIFKVLSFEFETNIFFLIQLFYKHDQYVYLIFVQHYMNFALLILSLS